MKNFIEKIRIYFINRFKRMEKDFQYFYVIMEDTKYHELIDEFSNSFMVYRVRKSKFMGESYDLIEDGFITLDQAELFVKALVKREAQFNKEGIRAVKEFSTKINTLNV